MLKSFKTEINPTEEQKTKIRKTIGTCRYIYNFYLAQNKELHENGKKFMSSNQFIVWLNNEYLSKHPEYFWIRIDNNRTDYINKTIAEIVKTKPSYITIENLNVSGMMKNKHLSKAVASQKFYEFRTKLQAKCRERGIELRVVDRWYPSSKTCHCCGAVRKDLKLSDRIFQCDCGYIEDRDFNAALNLRDATTYEVA